MLIDKWFSLISVSESELNNMEVFSQIFDVDPVQFINIEEIKKTLKFLIFCFFLHFLFKIIFFIDYIIYQIITIG